MDTGASPLAPATGAAPRQSAAGRGRAGARPPLRRRRRDAAEAGALGAVEVLQQRRRPVGAEVKEIATERDAVQAVTLADGTTLKSPLVLSTLGADRSRLDAGRSPPSGAADATAAQQATVEPARVKLTLGALPKFPGLDAATLASGAIVRLAPAMARLVQAHGAFRRHALSAEPCLDITIAPRPSDDGKQRWDAHVAMAYLPP